MMLSLPALQLSELVVQQLLNLGLGALLGHLFQLLPLLPLLQPSQLAVVEEAVASLLRSWAAEIVDKDCSLPWASSAEGWLEPSSSAAYPPGASSSVPWVSYLRRQDTSCRGQARPFRLLGWVLRQKYHR